MRLGIVAMLCTASLHSQTASPRPVFSLTSVKLHAGTGPEPIGGPRPRFSGNRVRWTNIPLRQVALYAYGIPGARLAGNLLQTFEETYDIDAVVEGSPSEDQVRLMFRALLEDRFAVKAHWETRQMQFYRLVAAKDGPRLQSASADPDTKIAGYAFPRGYAGVISQKVDEQHLVGRAATTEQLANAIGTGLRELVVDQTGVQGTFDFDIVFQLDESLNGAAGHPFLRPALEKALGLRVEPAKGPIEVLLIDHLGKLTEN